MKVVSIRSGPTGRWTADLRVEVPDFISQPTYWWRWSVWICATANCWAAQCWVQGGDWEELVVQERWYATKRVLHQNDLC